jgi:hypothetical protein
MTLVTEGQQPPAQTTGRTVGGRCQCYDHPGGVRAAGSHLVRHRKIAVEPGEAGRDPTGDVVVGFERGDPEDQEALADGEVTRPSDERPGGCGGRCCRSSRNCRERS